MTMPRLRSGRLTIGKTMGVVASVAVSCAWPPFSVPTVFVLLALFLPGSMTLAVATWNLASLAMFFLYAYAIAPAMAYAYEVRYGDIQASYGRYEWISTLAASITIPLLPTVISVWLYDRLLRRPSDWKRIIAASLFAVVVLVPILMGSYWFGLPYEINRIAWAVNGPPENLYGFTNMVLPRIIAWLVCTIPVCVAVLALHSKAGGQELKELDPTSAEPPPKHAA